MNTNPPDFEAAIMKRLARLQSLSPEELKREPVHLVYATWSGPWKKELDLPSDSSVPKVPERQLAAS